MESTGAIKGKKEVNEFWEDIFSSKAALTEKEAKELADEIEKNRKSFSKNKRVRC